VNKNLSLPSSSKFEIGHSHQNQKKKKRMVIQETVKEEDYMGKINISPSQVALIVDHYLCANNLSQTRATFRMEASSLFVGSPLSQVTLFPINNSHFFFSFSLNTFL